MTLRIIFLLFLCIPFSGWTQTFYKAWGSTSTFEAGEAITLYNGDIVVGGTKNDSAFVMRLTSTGNLVWLKRFKSAASTRDYVVFLNSTSDGYIIGTGFTTGTHDNSGFYFKMDGAGNFSFLKGSSGMYYFRSIHERTPNEYVVFGAATDVSTGTDVDLKIFSVNKTSGNIISQTQRMNIVSSGFGFTDDMESAIVIDSNNIYSTGRIYLSASNNMRPHLIKYDRNNNVKWSKYLHGPVAPTRRCYPHGLLYQSPNTFYLSYFSDITCAGSCSNYVPGLIKVDTAGNVIFDKTYDIIGSNGELVRNVVSDGLYLYIVGFTNFNSGSRDIFILKVDINGNLIKARSFGTSTVSEQFMISFITPVATDSSYIYISGGKGTTTSSDLFVMKIDTALNLACGSNIISCNPQTIPPSSINNTISLIADVGSVANRTNQVSHVFNESMPCTTPSSITDTLAFSSGGTVLEASYPGASYQWSTGETTNSITVSSVGSYSCLVTVGCCSFYHQFVVQTCTFGPLSITTSPASCPGDTLELILAGSYSFTTSFHSVNYAGNNIFTVPDTGVNVYSIHAISASGCSKDTSYNFFLPPPDPITFIGPPSFCSGDSVTLQITGDYSFTWTEGATTYTGSSIDILADTSHTFNISGINTNGCTVDSVYSFALSICSLINLNDTIYLNDSTTVLSAYDSSANGYSWSTGDTSSSVNISTAGTYTCTISINCCAYTHSFTVIYCSGLPIVISQNDPHCFEDTLHITLSGPYSSYTWNDGTVSFTGPTNVITLSGTYNYEITATNDYGCVKDTFLTISLDLQDSVSVTGPSAFCPGDTITLNATGDYAFTWTTWISGTAIHYTGSSISIPANTDQFFSISGVDSNGCTITTTYPLLVPEPEPLAVSYLPNDVICKGDIVTIQLSGSYTYQWADGTNTFSGNTHSIIADTIVQFHVIGTDTGGCTLIDTTFQIIPVSYPSAEFATDSRINDCQDKTWHFFATGLTGNYTWLINGTEVSSANSFYTTLPPGNNNILLVADNMGCKDSSLLVLYNDTLGVIIQNILIPNIFTPNGDGINDYFQIHTTVLLKSFSVSIFDRWGILVYQTTDPDFKWDGKFNADSTADGMYLYLIKYVDPCSSENTLQEVNGWVHVTR